MALDHSRLGLENKFLGNKSGRIFLRSTGLLYKILPCVNQPFILFIHHIWGETVLFIVQTSDRMLYCTIFQDKLHSVNIQDDQSWAFSETKNFQNHPDLSHGQPVVQPVLISNASCQSGRVLEWTLIELRFNIITNLVLLLFVI